MISVRKNRMNQYEHFIKRLASGTTCKPFVEFIEEYRGYIIFHHKSHQEWLDRGYGNITCKAYLAYIKFNSDIDNVNRDDLFHHVKKVNARKTKKNIDYIVKTIIDGEIIENE